MPTYATYRRLREQNADMHSDTANISLLISTGVVEKYYRHSEFWSVCCWLAETISEFQVWGHTRLPWPWHTDLIRQNSWRGKKGTQEIGNILPATRMMGEQWGVDQVLNRQVQKAWVLLIASPAPASQLTPGASHTAGSSCCNHSSLSAFTVCSTAACGHNRKLAGPCCTNKAWFSKGILKHILFKTASPTLTRAVI